MTDVSVAGCVVRLDAIALELDELSKALASVERMLEPIEEEYDIGLGEYEAAMFDAYQSGEGRWPGEETRERLYRRTLPVEFRHQRNKLLASRKRMEKRIGTLKASADAQRSVLSALKVELEATR